MPDAPESRPVNWLERFSLMMTGWDAAEKKGSRTWLTWWWVVELFNNFFGQVLTALGVRRVGFVFLLYFSNPSTVKQLSLITALTLLGYVIEVPQI